MDLNFSWAIFFHICPCNFVFACVYLLFDMSLNAPKIFPKTWIFSQNWFLGIIFGKIKIPESLDFTDFFSSDEFSQKQTSQKPLCHGATPNILFTGKDFILLYSDEITVSSGNSRHLPLKSKSFFTFNSIFCTKTSKKDPQNLRSLQSSKSLPLLVVIVVPSGIHSSIRARGY